MTVMRQRPRAQGHPEEKGTPFDEFESRCSVPLGKWPDFDDFASLIGYHLAVIFWRVVSPPFLRISAYFRGFRGDPEPEVITDRSATREFAPDFGHLDRDPGVHPPHSAGR